MRESRLSGSVEGVMSDHDSYSDCEITFSAPKKQETHLPVRLVVGRYCGIWTELEPNLYASPHQ